MEIGISSWSMHREIGQNITLFEFLHIVHRKYKLSSVELLDGHIRSCGMDSLEKVNKALEIEELNLVNIPVDAGDISQQDEQKRSQDIDTISEWIDAASFLGSPAIRVNTHGRKDNREDLERIIESYQILCRRALPKGITILIENHGGVSYDPAYIEEIIRRVNATNIGTCPDNGNFPAEIRYDGITKIAPYMKLAHLKTFDFNDDGTETTMDIGRIIDIYRRVGYDGVLSIEYEGTGDQYEGVEKTIELIKRYI